MQVYEFRETPEPMIVMDYYPAGNIMNVDVFNEELYISAMGQILDGLSHLHKTEIAHRDLKPENLLIKTDPVFKIAITDFGFAKSRAHFHLAQDVLWDPQVPRSGGISRYQQRPWPEG